MKFKAGDVVVCLYPDCWPLTVGKQYVVQSVTELYIRVVNDKGNVGGYNPKDFELVTTAKPVLTPEEVFENLRKGTKLQYKQEASPKGWRDCSNPQFANILNRVWRIKPEPEVIELNGKKYREIVD